MSAPKKSLGQNFLMHRQTAERIVEAAQLPRDAVVLEIGPGTGMLTRELLKKAAKVIAVEADDQLIPELENTFSEEIAAGRLVLVHQDIRHFDSSTIKTPYILVANIPYYITGEIIRQFLTAAHKPSSMTLLVQKEVAERIARLDEKKPKESILSLSVKAYGVPKYRFTVPRGAFFPAPSVDSAVLSIETIRQDAFKSPAEENLFFDLVKAGFAHKRKVLLGNLREKFGDSTKKAFEKLNIPLSIRSEDLSLSDWQSLVKELSR